MLRPLSIALLAALLAAAVFAPWLGTPLLAAGFSVLCQQNPERSLAIGGAHLPLCARCLGIYAGAVLGLILGFAPRRRFLLFAAAALFLDWASEAGGLRPPLPASRLMTGMWFGAAAAPVVEAAVSMWEREVVASPLRAANADPS